MLYRVVAEMLKDLDSSLMIGGPAVTGPNNWGFVNNFLKYMKSWGGPVDFVSWHYYVTMPDNLKRYADLVRTRLDDLGFKQTKSILGEWNMSDTAFLPDIPGETRWKEEFREHKSRGWL